MIGKYFVLFLKSWLAGFLAYVGITYILSQQTIPMGELGSVIVVTLLAYGIGFTVIYLPVLHITRNTMKHPTSWAYAAVASLLGLIPISFIITFFGGSFSDLLTPESLLFGVMFIAVAIVLGHGYAAMTKSTK